ncbi:phosphotransferase RcsD [Proteus vulgaris]|uniref:phosphotransferase RcsD n=1 Tax=Proteus vulgaris TaxID=585 RepID=UPI000C9F884B|nr:phosphotransferase RcsD [Proteus vulgaris]UBH60717.1 phosphotransferase RcsD [Proteus vulgaris]VTP84781.1 phosphotransfer intermediate protein in two-component regulatory system with RcsBC [Proteus vulgaris]
MRTLNQLKPNTLTRLYALFLLFMVISLFLYAYSYFDTWLDSKKNAINNTTHKFALQVEDYRYHSNQLFQLSNKVSDTSAFPPLPLNPIKLRSDVFWLEGRDQTIDAIIFGKPNEQTFQLAQRFANSLEIIWGVRNDYSSLYYLNGKGNDLILITTHSVLKPEIRYKESYLTLTAENKRSELLMQSTALDEKESLSPIRKMSTENIYYYTYRIMFNVPGQLTSVVAFDLPINNFLPSELSPHYLRLLPTGQQSVYDKNNIEISTDGSSLIFSQPIAGIPYSLSYEYPLKLMIKEIAYKNIWLLISLLAFISISVFGHIYIRNKYVFPYISMTRNLRIKEEMTNDIISNLPIGLLVYNFSSNHKIISNSHAEKLLPHIDLSKIRQMAIEHNGLIQTAINNEIYEIRTSNNSNIDNTLLFIFLNKDNEALINKKLQLAQQEYEKNTIARRKILSNMSLELMRPIKDINEMVYQFKELLPESTHQQLLSLLLEKTNYISEWIENITLINKLENQEWKIHKDEFELSTLVESILITASPFMIRKGLTLYFHNNIRPGLLLINDGPALSKIILSLINYAISTTNYGKITVNLNLVKNKDQDKKEIVIDIIDSGSGLTPQDIANIKYPFLGQAIGDKYYSNSGIIFYLCHLLCNKIQGELTIKSQESIGSHFRIVLPYQHIDTEERTFNVLLEGINAKIAIKNPEIEKIICQQLDKYGATYFDKNRENLYPEYDIILKDTLDDSPESPTILLMSAIVGFEKISKNLIKCNYNFGDPLIEAITYLIEENASFSLDTNEESILDENNNLDNYEVILNNYRKKLNGSDYKELFISTVPIDVEKLHLEATNKDFHSLAQTAHRLKGVFAMLDLEYLRESCEYLEHDIKNHNELEIEERITQLDKWIQQLLQQGNN